MYLEKRKQKMSLGQKIDLALKAVRVCLVHGDLPAAKTHIKTAHECVGLTPKLAPQVAPPHLV